MRALPEMTVESEGSVAVFVDAENLTGWLARDGVSELLGSLTEFGPVIVRRAYGKWTTPNLANFQGPLNRQGFELMHTYHPVKGKNSVDIQLTVDVMGYAWGVPALRWIVLATGDSDFSPLFRRLREMGKNVIGVGPRGKLSEAVKSSCTRFIHTDPVEPPAGQPDPTASQRDWDDALQVLEAALNTFAGPANCAALKNRMLGIDAAFDEKRLGHRQFLSFLRASGIVRIDEAEEGTWLATLVDDASEAEPPGPDTTPAPAEYAGPERTLRQHGWRSPSAPCLADTFRVLIAIDQHLTRAEMVDAIMDEVDDSIEAADIRKAINVMYKARLFDRVEGVEQGRWRLRRGLAHAGMIDAVDEALIRRALPKDAATPVPVDALPPLLFGAQDRDRLLRLIRTARGESPAAG